MSNYKTMNNETVVDYVKSLGLFDKNAELKGKEIGDGNLNLVFRVKDEKSGKSVIIKQALPHLRINEGWKLTLDRNRIEAEAMIEQDKACPDSVPKVYHHSDEYALSVVEDLGGMETLRNGLIEMKQYPKFSEQIGKFLARNLFYTSDYGISPMEKKKKVDKFISPELCDITERLVLSDPYYNCESNDINEYIKDDAKALWERKDVRLETAKLKNIFMTKAEALLHGDLHTGSVFISPDRIVVFDTEFAFYGPYGYDIGLLFANFILNYASLEANNDKSKDEIKSYRKYLIDTVCEIWSNFEKDFSELWDNDSKEVTTKVEGYKEAYVNNLLHETIGFCACEIMRRVVGMAHVPELDLITDDKEKAKAQRLALKIAEEIIVKRESINNINELKNIIQSIQ